MMIYCAKCHWCQDDFWELGFTSVGPGYTPLRHDIIDNLRNRLFEDRCYFDRSFFEENKLNPDGQDERGFWIKGTKYVAWDLRRRADRIERAVYRTYEEWNVSPNKWKCPKCDGEVCLD